MSRDRIQIKTKPIFAYLASHFHPEVVKKKNNTTKRRGATHEREKKGRWDNCFIKDGGRANYSLSADKCTK